jgi:signal transduction histidine kinase/HAMP domain-containing protein
MSDSGQISPKTDTRCHCVILGVTPPINSLTQLPSPPCVKKLLLNIKVVPFWHNEICQFHAILRNGKKIAGIMLALFDLPVDRSPAVHPMTRHLSSLRFRLIVLILVAVIPAFGVILYSAARHRDLTANQVQRNALAAARAIAAEQERFLENAHQFLVMLSRVPQIRENNRTSCSKFLAALLEPLYADLGITDLKGNVLCSALPPKTSLAKPTGPHLSRIKESYDFSVGEIRTDSSSGKTLVHLGFPLQDSPGVVRAVIIAVVNLSWVTRVTAENHLYPGASFTLVDSRSNVFLRYPQGRDWIAKPIFGKVPDEEMIFRDTEKTVESPGADGVRRLFAFSQLKSPVGSQSAYAVIDIPAAMAFAEADRILVHNLIILGLLAALTLVAAWIGADVFVLRRIRDIVAATKQITAGKLSARTRLPYGKTELGQMAHAFDDLAEALEKREAEADVTAKQIHKQRQQQNALYDLNLAITSTLDLASVLTTLLDEISALFPCCAATVSWINNQSGALEVIAQRNLDNTDETQQEVAIEEGLPLVVMKRQSHLAISNAQMDPRTTNPEFFRHHRLLFYLGMPLIAKGEVLGVLSFYAKDERGFTAEEMNFLKALVNQAAIAIYNSRLYEQTRNQAFELEKSNKIKDEFLGVMSHELRTPLNIIMNYAEALRMGTFGEISRNQEKGTEKIHSQAGHLLTLINGILEITKIESGTVTVQGEPLDLADFMDENRSDYMMPTEKNIILKWEYPADLPVIISDRMKLKQILTNLINNAIKFTEKGVVNISVQTLDHGHALELKVADTGPGISNESLSFVFDKFRQIDSTTTRSHSGAGLGLYIVKTFVELLGGTITVESRLGEGSVFTVRLPVEPATASTQAGHAPTAASQRFLN